jgi:hypothetical protein
MAARSRYAKVGPLNDADRWPASKIDGYRLGSSPLRQTGNGSILKSRWRLVRIVGHGQVKDPKVFPGGARLGLG